MSPLKTFFRHCPSCGSRFEIHLVSKEQIDESDRSVSGEGTPGGAALGGVSSAAQPGPFVDLGMADRPVVVDIKEFRYAYRCGKCGHAWTETEIKE